MYEFRLSTTPDAEDGRAYVTMEIWDQPGDGVSFPERLWHQEVAVDPPAAIYELSRQMRDLLVASAEHL